MTRVMPPLSPLQRFYKIRRKVYIVVIVVGLLTILFPFVAHASDIFKNDVIDVYQEITDNVSETNEILSKAFSFCRVSPYDVLNQADNKVSRAVHDGCQTLAVVIATFLLLVDFFKKATTFEWSSKWENVLIFLIKVIVVKQVVQNADVIVQYIYALFNWLNTQALNAAGSTLLPSGTKMQYTIRYEESLLKDMWEEGVTKGWSKFWENWGAGEDKVNFVYNIDWDAVHMFFPNANVKAEGGWIVEAGTYDYTAHKFAYPTSTVFQPTLKIILMQPYFLVMKAIAYLIFVIAIGRVFELCIYTLFAPLPLATFAGDGTHDVGKSFIKNYIATVLQIATIIVMFIVYLGMNKFFNADVRFKSMPLIQFIVLISLGLGVMKSGTWSRKICGIG